jgi:hypothetical protein
VWFPSDEITGLAGIGDEHFLIAHPGLAGSVIKSQTKISSENPEEFQDRQAGVLTSADI